MFRKFLKFAISLGNFSYFFIIILKFIKTIRSYKLLHFPVYPKSMQQFLKYVKILISVFSSSLLKLFPLYLIFTITFCPLLPFNQYKFSLKRQFFSVTRKNIFCISQNGLNVKCQFKYLTFLTLQFLPNFSGGGFSQSKYVNLPEKPHNVTTVYAQLNDFCSWWNGRFYTIWRTFKCGSGFETLTNCFCRLAASPRTGPIPRVDSSVSLRMTHSVSSRRDRSKAFQCSELDSKRFLKIWK